MSIIVDKSKISSKFKIKIPAGKANPAPPVGAALGQRKVNIMSFCKDFNDYCAKNLSEFAGDPVTASVVVFKDFSYSFSVSLPSVSFLIKKLLNLKKGANKPGKEIVGQVKTSDLVAVAKSKIVDLNVGDLDAAVKVVSGTAISMGIKVVG